MRRSLLLLAAFGVAGCSSLGDAGAPVAIEVITPSPAFVEIGDTITLRARVLDQAGDSIAATIRWRTPDDTLVAVDSVTGRFTGLRLGLGRVQAVSGSLVGPVSTFNVHRRADSVIVAVDSILVPASDSVSAALEAKVADSTGAGSQAHELRFTIVPPSPAGARLSGNVTADTVTSDAAGLPATPVRVRRAGLAASDTVTVQVDAKRFGGSTIPGSGRKIRVFFQ